MPTTSPAPIGVDVELFERLVDDLAGRRISARRCRRQHVEPTGQGTERNRKAVDWIEAQLKSYGCPTERLKYEYNPAPPNGGRAGRRPGGGQKPPNPIIASGEVRSDRAARAIAGITRAHRRQQRSQRAARREAARAQSRADDPGPARGGLLHQGRHHPPRRDVHRRRAHGRPRLGRGRQRQRIGHGAGDGAGAHLQHARRADRAHDPLRAVEQRGDRPQRRARLRRAARRCRARRIRRDRAAIPSRSGSA